MEPIIKKEQLTEDQVEQLREYFKIYDDVIKTADVPEKYLEFQKGAIQALIHIFGDEIFNR